MDPSSSGPGARSICVGCGDSGLSAPSTADGLEDKGDDAGRWTCESGGRVKGGVPGDVVGGLMTDFGRVGDGGGMKVAPPRMVARLVDGVREETELEAERVLCVGRKGVA